MSTSNDATVTSDAIAQTSTRGATARPRTPFIVLLIAILFILIGGLLANITQTAGGQVRVRQVNFAGTNGMMMSGLLYVPNAATTKSPACGVVAIHGYINSHDTMDGFSIEMARRGCVVLAVDQTGHGSSDAPSFANGYGGPDALAYLSSLSIVRKGDIGLIGHSMGGWASVIAASAHPDAYRSLILVSSSTSTPQLEPIPGTPTFPKNVEVLEAQDSEFSQLMWLEPTGSQFPDSPRMKELFGVTSTIQVNHVYGSIADGTARVLALVPTTHPGITFSNEGVGDAVSWMQQTLDGVSTLPTSDQIWIWDEIGTFLALIGVLLLIFPAGSLLLRLRFFAELVGTMPASKAARGIGWAIGALLLILIAILTFYLFNTIGEFLVTPNAVFPQQITNGIMVWALGGGLIGLVLFVVWHFALNRRQGARLHHYGVTGENNRLEWKKIGKALLYAMLVIAPTYIAVSLLDWAFNTDARIWIFNIKPINAAHFPILLAYIIPFGLYFLVLGVILHGQLRLPRLAPGWEIVKNMAVLAGGFVVFLLAEYIPLLSGHTLLNADQPLLTIVAYQFVPVYLIIAAVSTYFYQKTGRIYAGAFICAILIPALIVASTATQFGG
ncbi:MAG TPA: alpha/beta hydrolase [Ktedonosporobacter sp.]|nr:alpha/beta hydrolase [Ktedonosporobacter sp.]